VLSKASYACIVFFLASVCTSSYSEAFILGGWLPYWRTRESIASATHAMSYLHQVSPFSYEVDNNGNLIDTFDKNRRAWRRFFAACRSQNIKIIPTIFWTKTHALHTCLSSNHTRNNHVNQIMRKIIRNKFDGININYERVQPKDREFFLRFMEQLSQRLHERKLLLCCSMGGRTSDKSVGLYTNNATSSQRSIPAVSLNPGQGKSGQRYKKRIAQCCDQVHIMGYDEWGVPAKYNPLAHENNYFISHASNQWIEQIIRYALSYIPADKLILGIPTYGLEFCIYNPAGDYSYKKTRNITYPEACRLVREHKQEPVRTLGGELSFTYTHDNKLHYVCYMDSAAIKDKLELARKYKLKGVYIFKIDGLEDPALWKTLTGFLRAYSL
jgi:spore germination protein YaaH